MSKLSIGDKAPHFTMPRDGGAEVSLSDFDGQYLVLYFYPKDNTPGCTTEGKAFTAAKADFAKLNAEIVGVSRDSVKKHDNFVAKQELDVILGADLDGNVTENYGVWVEKSMYGKQYMGIQRATFLINPAGEIAHIWPKVRVKGHVEDVLETLKTHSK